MPYEGILHKGKTLAQALADSATHANDVYFCTDAPVIVHNGRVIGTRTDTMFSQTNVELVGSPDKVSALKYTLRIKDCTAAEHVYIALRSGTTIYPCEFVFVTNDWRAIFTPAQNANYPVFKFSMNPKGLGVGSILTIERIIDNGITPPPIYGWAMTSQAYTSWEQIPDNQKCLL